MESRIQFFFWSSSTIMLPPPTCSTVATMFFFRNVVSFTPGGKGFYSVAPVYSSGYSLLPVSKTSQDPNLLPSQKQWTIFLLCLEFYKCSIYKYTSGNLITSAQPKVYRPPAISRDPMLVTTSLQNIFPKSWFIKMGFLLSKKQTFMFLI